MKLLIMRHATVSWAILSARYRLVRGSKQVEAILLNYCRRWIALNVNVLSVFLHCRSIFIVDALTSIILLWRVTNGKNHAALLENKK